MHGLLTKKVHVLNQGVVHLINVIFGIVGSKLSRPANRCYLIIGIIAIILFSLVIVII
jgi:hypothetical protein